MGNNKKILVTGSNGQLGKTLQKRCLDKNDFTNNCWNCHKHNSRWVEIKKNIKDAEIYYLMGLEIDPKHNGINEYLGELYVQTNRIDKANERLEVLKTCNCKEYQELELIIKTRGTKIY